jgi:hypothetical protein
LPSTLDKLFQAGFEALPYELHSPHAMISSWGGMSPPKDPNMVKPASVQRLAVRP